MLLLYGSATIGATVHIHYCMNKFTGISFIEKKNAVCNNCGMPKDKGAGCCHDECKQLKLSTDQLTNPASQMPDVCFTAVVAPFITGVVKIPVAYLVEKVSHAPPGALQKIYMQNNAWRI